MDDERRFFGSSDPYDKDPYSKDPYGPQRAPPMYGSGYIPSDMDQHGGYPGPMDGIYHDGDQGAWDPRDRG